MSSSIALRRSPNPGALTAATFRPPRSLLTTKVANASPSTSSATISSGFPNLTADSSNGSNDCRLDSFFEAERDTLLKPASDEAVSPAAMLARLKGIGPETAAVLWSEGLFRQFDNRRQVAAYAGLAPTPWKSGSIDHEQGVSKAGNPRLRTAMVELAWLWLQNQPTTALSLWFHERVQRLGGRMRKTIIVAVARKLLIALWRYTTAGVVIEGAVMKTASATI